MERETESASTVNEEPAVELIEENVNLVVENAESIPTENDQPNTVGREVLVVESVANRKIQFAETFKPVNRATSNWVEKVFILVVVGTLVRAFFHGLTGDALGVIYLVVALVAMRYVGVLLKSISFSKNRYELSEDSFRAYGRSKENDWLSHCQK